MNGTQVTLFTRVQSGTDEFNAAIYDEQSQVVEDVLVYPSSTADLGAERPEGATVDYTLYWPKTFTGELKGAQVEIGGERFKVVGDPRPIPHNCPTRWNRTSEVVKVYG